MHSLFFLPLPDINECERDPCKNGGICTDLVANYSCECPGEYMGRNCQYSKYSCFFFWQCLPSNSYNIPLIRTAHLMLQVIALLVVLPTQSDRSEKRGAGNSHKERLSSALVLGAPPFDDRCSMICKFINPLSSEHFRKIPTWKKQI